MLKGKRGISTCSLSSCRIRAEALARAFNTRFWPCVWIPQRLSAERTDGMSNGIDDDEEFFDASPSPVETEDESLHCEQHSSAATEAGRAKLYELLQQHASDDAIDVFYDVGEETSLTDSDATMCLKGEVKNSIEENNLLESSNMKCENDVKPPEPFSLDANQSNGTEIKCAAPENISEELGSKCDCCDDIKCPFHPSDATGEDNTENICVSNTLKSHTENFNIGNVENITMFSTEDTIEITIEEKLSNIEEVTVEKTENNSNSFENIGNDFIDTCAPITVLSTDAKDVYDNGVSPLSENEHQTNDLNLTVNTKYLENSKTLNIQTTEDITTPPAFSSNESKYVSNEMKDTNSENIDLIIGKKEIDFSSNESVCVSTEMKNINPENIDLSSRSKEIDESNNNEEITSEIKIIEEAASLSPSSDSSETKCLSPIANRLHIFDEVRPKIARTTSLKTGKTPPGTPSRKKIVRFADVLGLDLEDVRHIMSGDLPIIPSSAYTDLDLKDADLPSSQLTSETLEIKSRPAGSWKTLPGFTATNVLYPAFSIPGEQPDFFDRVRCQGICLETVIVSEMSVQCTCKVMNYGFHKRIIARYTFNDWISTNDIDASYIQGSSNGEMDSFAFSIFLSPMNSSLKFAIKYIVNGKEYWDNNRCQDYCFNYHGNDPIHHVTSPSWQHQFW